MYREKRVSIITIVVVTLCTVFISCTGEKGPTGPQGSKGDAGTPRRMFIHRSYVDGISSGYTNWSYTTGLPWVPALNGVIANLRGYECISEGWTTTTDVGCRINSIAVAGASVTIGGWIYIVDAASTPYAYIVSFDIIAYDTLATIKFEEKKPPSIESILNRGAK